MTTFQERLGGKKTLPACRLQALLVIMSVWSKMCVLLVETVVYTWSMVYSVFSEQKLKLKKAMWTDYASTSEKINIKISKVCRLVIIILINYF